MKIIILGYMASGKSFVGKVLSKKMALPFIDLDNFIEEKEAMSIPEIFKKQGEIYFRTIENKYLKELLSNQEDYVLSLGGGTPCYADNMEHIKNQKDTVSFYLKASINTIVERLKKEKDQRPLVSNLKDKDLNEFIAKHLFERNGFYDQASQTIKIDQKDIETIIEEIVQTLN